MNPAATLAIRVVADTARARAGLSGVESQLHQTKREADKNSASFNSMSRDIKKAGVDADRSSRGFGRMSRSVITANQGMSLLRNSIKLMKWPTLIAGAGAAAEGLSAAAGGATALVGALAPGVGLITQYGVALTTLGQVKAVIALSGLNDVGTAVGTVTEKLDKQSAEFKRLSPEAQRFAEQLDKLQSGPLRALQKVVQEPLFSGFSKGLQAAQKSLSSFKTVLQATAGSIGFVAEQAGKFVGSKGFGRDFEKFGLTNARVIRMMGLSAINLGHALADILVAARPLTNWIQDGILSWSEWVKQTTQAARTSGVLASFFRQTRDVTGDLVSMLRDMGMALFNILKLGQPLGNLILDKLVKAAQAFREWTESARGQNVIARYFRQIQPALMQAGKLLADLVKAFFRVGKESQGALAPLLKSVRIDLLPLFTKLIASTSKAFGPAVVKLLVQVTKLFVQLAGQSGPLMIFVRTLTNLTKALNWMIDNVPGFKSVVITLLGLKGVGMALSFLTGGKLIAGLVRLRGALFGVAAAETAATTVPTAGLIGKGGMLATLATTLKGAVNPAMFAPVGIAIAAGIVVGITTRPLQHKLADVFHDLADKMPDFAQRAAHSFASAWDHGLVDLDLGTSLKDLVLGDSAPALKSLEELVGDRLHNVASDFFYLADRVKRAMGRIVKNIGGETFREAVASLKHVYGDIQTASANMTDAQRRAWINLAKTARDQGQITTNQFKKYVDALKSGSRDASRAVGDSSQSIHQDNQDQQHDFQNTTAAIDNATRKQSKDVDRFRDDHHRATKGIVNDNQDSAHAFANAEGKVGKATGKMGGSIHSLAKAIAKGEKNIQDNTNKSLKAFGAKELKFILKDPKAQPGFASPQVGGIAQPGGFLYAQRGMQMVPGVGSGDKVPAYLEPGEVVVNREAVKRMGGAKRVNMLNEMIPRFATGGTVGMQPAAQALATRFVQMFGGSITSGLRAGDSGSFHSQGLAFDWAGGDWNAASRYSNQIGPQLLEGIHNAPPGQNVSWDSGHSVPSSFWGSATWADHVDHIHIAVSQAVKGAISEIQRVLLRGPKGPLRDLGQGALDKTVDAANAFIAKMMPTQGVEGTGSGAVMSPAQIARLWTQVNDGLADASTMARIAMAESSGDPGAIGHDPGGTTGYGLWQITSGFHDDLIRRYDPILNPTNNALAAASIFRDQGYGAWAASSANWQKGGIIQMLANGGFVGDVGGGGGEVLFPGFLDLLPKAVRRDIKGADRKHPARHTKHVEKLMTRFKDSLSEFVVPSKVNETMEALAMNADMGADYALRAQGLTEMKSVMYDNALAPWLDAAMEEPNIATALAKIIPENATALQALRDQPKILQELKGPLYNLLPGRAKEALDMLDGQGFLIPEAFNGKNELGWLLSELQNILGLRNQLLEAMKVADEETEKVKAWIDRAKKALDRLKGRRGLKGVEHDIDHRHRQVDRLNKKLGLKKGNYEHVDKHDKDIDPEGHLSLHETLHLWNERERRIKDLRHLENKEQFYKAELKPLAQAQKMLGGWGPHAGIPGGWNYSGPYGEVMDLIQGRFSTDRKVKLRTRDTAPWISVPPLGLLGGDFMDKQATIMSWLPEQKFDGGFFGGGGFDTGVDDNAAELLALTQEKLLDAQRRLLVSQAQYPVFQQFAGLFARGGYIPGGQWGIAGERGPEIVHGPASVTPAGGAVTVEMNFASGMEWLEQFVDVKVRHGNQRNVSYARRRA